MNINKTKLPKSQLEITIELSVEELEPYLKKAIEKISNEKKIEGFRPGKVPYEILKQRFGEMTIYGQAADLAIPEKLWEAVKDDRLEIVAQPQIEIIKLAPDNPFVFKAILTLLPETTKLADYRGIKIKRKEIKIEEKQIDELLKELQSLRAKEVLEDKPVEKGDKVEVNYDISIDRVALENGLVRKHPIIIGESHLIPGFEEQLLGMKREETKEFKLTFPKEHYQKNLAGREVNFKVKVGNVYKRELPEINDEFAKSLGRFSDLQGLKNQLRQNLIDEASLKEEQKIEIEILNQIINNSRFEDIPDVLINSEAHKMLQELEGGVESQGVKFDDYLRSLKKTADQLLLDFAPQALKRVKSALVIKEIAKRENIQINKEEVDAEIEKTLQLYPADTTTQEKIRSPGYREYLKEVLINRKVIEFLKSLIIE